METLRPFYRFGYEQDTSRYPFKGGVTHSDDLIYIFPNPPQVTPLNQTDTQMAKEIIDLWTSFATNGLPRIADNGPNKNFAWPPIVKG